MSTLITDTGHFLELAQNYLHQNHFDETIKICVEILKTEPKNQYAFYYMGLANFKSGKLQMAIQQVQTAIDLDAKRPEFLCDLGEIFEALGAKKEAESYYRKALVIDRINAKALIKLGSILVDRDQFKSGIMALEKACELEPKNITSVMLLADAKYKIGQIIDALELYLLATSIGPLQESARNKLAAIHMTLEDWEKARTEFKKTLILAPHHNGPYSNIGFVYMNYGDFVSARRFFKLSITIRSDVGNAFCGLAELSFLENNLSASLEYSKTAIELEPNNYHFQSRRALQLLANGNITEGWIMRDARLMLDDRIDHRQRPPRWDGSSLEGKSLLITAEEGIGDELFFAGCFNDIIAECDRCFIECDPRLVELYKRSFPTATIGATERTGSRFKPTQSYNWVPKTPPVDFSIEAGSLFQFVRSDWKKFSGKKPYLVPDKKLQASWKEYIKKIGLGLKIGFCWRSKYHDGFRKYHYAELEDWIKVLSTPNCNFIPLQYGEGWEKELYQLPNTIRSKITIIESVDMSNDFESICAVASSLDLIICPSSTVSWIGGGLGVPTWVAHLQPNWTRLGTNEFPSFPTMQSFPKNIFEPWSECFDPIKTKLDNLAK